MDSISQIVLGAGVAEICLGRRIGWRAAAWGAVLGTIPDLDVLPSKIFGLLDPVTEMDVHRGFSHSIVFCILLSPLLARLMSRIHKKWKVDFKSWLTMCFLALITHPLLDCFTTWGTQLFWPLDYRVAWKSVFVVDPLYTIPFIVCLVMALRLGRDNPKRSKYAWWGLRLSTSYLLLTLVNKGIADTMFESSIKDSGLECIRYDTRPTMLNSILWAGNVETEDAFYIGYRSFFDSSTEAGFRRISKQKHLLEPYLADERIQTILRINQGYYTVEKTDVGLIINDLRFGMMEDEVGTPRFIFAFTIEEKDGDLVILPTERNVKTGKRYLSFVMERIQGN